jgi:hypothetical protein
MHGPAYIGDCPQALRDLASAYDQRLLTEGARLLGPGLLAGAPTSDPGADRAPHE